MFVKLFRDILDSTIWMEEDHIVRVWLTFLLLCDSEGFVDVPIPAIALRARVSLDQAVDAVAKLEAPDEFSRTAEEDGRRIIRVTEEKTLWHIVNYMQYRRLEKAEQKKQHHRDYMRDYRKRKKKTHERETKTGKTTHIVKQGEGEGEGEGSIPPSSPPWGEESKSKKKPRKRFIPPTAAQVREYVTEKGYSIDPDGFVDWYASKGWMVGKNKMKDWKAAVRTWVQRDRKNHGDSSVSAFANLYDEEGNPLS